MAAPPAKIEKAAPPAPEPAASTAASAAGGGLKAWFPALAAIVLAPVATWATAEFVLVPRLQKKLALPPAAALAEMPTIETTKDGKPKAPPTYEFSNVVVNLAGTMGTRYLKATIIVVGDPSGKVDLKKAFEDNRTKLMDTTLTVLSSLTLADLEEPGARNIIREKLVSAYNQVLNRRVAEQVYFSDFVVQ
jgi:flagellar FliL protein